MPDREEWYRVELADGGTAHGAGGTWNDRQAAEAVAHGAASGTDHVLYVRRYTKEVVSTFKRTMTINVTCTEGPGDGDAR